MKLSPMTRMWLLTLGRGLIALIFLLPLFWMVSAALLPLGRPLSQTFRLLPSAPTLENFVRIWDMVPLARFTLHSLVIAAIAVPLTVVTGSWAGLAIAQLPRRSQRRWVVISLAVLMVPGIALWSTRFLIYTQLGWINTIWAIIAPAWMGTSPFYVLMFYRAFRRIPAAIYDTGRLDGVSALTMWRDIALPIARPTAMGVALLSFVVYWGDFLSPLLYLSGERWFTLPIALQLLQMMNRSEWPLLMAAAVWATMVPVILFLLVQPYFARHLD